MTIADLKSQRKNQVVFPPRPAGLLLKLVTNVFRLLAFVSIPYSWWLVFMAYIKLDLGSVMLLLIIVYPVGAMIMSPSSDTEFMMPEWSREYHIYSIACKIMSLSFVWLCIWLLSWEKSPSF